MGSAPTVFVVTIQATAGPENSTPDGRRYHLLVFARADDDAEAERVAVLGAGQLGWIEAEIVRVGEITNPDAVPEDFRGAFARARDAGCAVIVYDEP